MKTRPAYLVIEKGRKGFQIVRVTQTWPSLDPGQAIIRVSLELPDSFLSAPVHTIEIELDDITVAVESGRDEQETNQ